MSYNGPMNTSRGIWNHADSLGEQALEEKNVF